MKNIIKNRIELLKKQRYNYKHKIEALKALKEIQNDTGYVLSQKEKKMVNEYAIEIFGSSSYSHWLNVYTAYNQEFKEGWIPDNYFGYIITPIINKGIGSISNTKTLSKKIISTDLIPDCFYMIDRTLYDTNYNIIEPKDVFSTLFNLENEYFYKKDYSKQGKGVTKIDRNNFNLLDFYNSGDAVIQSPIIQMDWFNNIITGSVATIRITTVKDYNKNIVYGASYLRLGRAKSEVVQSEDTVRIPILDEEGNLGEFGLDSFWRRLYKHPDTNVEFSNLQIPYFQKAVKECIHLHNKIPHFSIIGWDVSITNEGRVKIIEWNAGHPDIKFTECTVGPCFANLGWENLHKKESVNE